MNLVPFVTKSQIQDLIGPPAPCICAFFTDISHEEIQENLSIYRSKFDHPNQQQDPGSISHLKEAFVHRQADRKCKNFYANEALLKVIFFT